MQLKHALGNDAYLFSVRSASLFIKAGMAESFCVKEGTLVERIFNTGKTIIEMSLANLPDPIAERFRLKFPKNFGWDFTHTVDNPQYYFEFIKKVAKRAIPESENIAVSLIKA
jgi:hypothetical protein